MAAPQHPTPPPSAPTMPDDWPSQAADKIVDVVGQAHDKITGPAITAARWVVYGLAAAFMGLFVGVIGLIGLVRVMNAYLPDAVFGESHVWAVYLILGAIFSAVGIWLLRKANQPPTDDPSS